MGLSDLICCYSQSPIACICFPAPEVETSARACMCLQTRLLGQSILTEL
jgi:hypothetical protein